MIKNICKARDSNLDKKKTYYRYKSLQLSLRTNEPVLLITLIF